MEVIYGLVATFLVMLAIGLVTHFFLLENQEKHRSHEWEWKRQQKVWQHQRESQQRLERGHTWRLHQYEQSQLRHQRERQYPGHEPNKFNHGNQGPATLHRKTELELAYDVLGIQPNQELYVAEAAYRAKMKRLHPDTGGTDEEAGKLTNAIDMIRKHKGE